MTYYIGLDQSYSSFGIVVLNQHSEVITFTRLVSDKQQDIFERSWNLANQVKNIVIEYQPAHIAIEGLAFGMRGSATRDLAGLQFSVVNLLRFHYNQSIEVVSPLSLKKFATKSGKSKKEDMLQALSPDILENFRKHYKKSSGLYDIIDAYWLAQYIRTQYNN